MTKTLYTSKYNSLIRDKEELLIYNSLYKTYVKSKKYEKEIVEILKNPNEYVNSRLCKQLMQYGFITEYKNEKKYADYKFYEFVFDNTLELCIMPTEQCNFRCIYCYENFLIGNLKKENIESLLLWLKKNIRNYNGIRVSWFGGEPLLALGNIYYISEKIIEICNKNHVPYAASITTNGYLLTKDVFKKLLSYKVLSYQITIDGNKENHDKNRKMINGSGTYDVIMNNLSDISKNIKSGIFRVILRNNITMESLNTLNQFIDEMFERFKEDKRFGFYFRPVGKWGKKEIDIDGSEMLNSLDDMFNIILSSDKTLNYLPYKSMLEEQMCFAQKRNQFVVRGDGRIAKCTMLLESEKNNIGNIENGKIFIDEYKVSKWLGLGNPKSKKCNECANYPTCYGKTCPAKGYEIKTKKICGYENVSVEYVLKILNRMGVFENLDEVENEFKKRNN